MPHLVTVAIVLSASGQERQVMVNGMDLSASCIGLDVSARDGELTEITLHLVGSVELMADVGRLEVEKGPT